MVFAIIAIIGVIGLLILFKDQIKAFADDLQKEPTEEEQDRQTEIDERGAITNTGTFLFGEDFANFGKNFNDKIKSEQFNKMAKEVKESQAKEAGFSSVEEFELKTDPSRTANLGLDELGKFNPPNTVGFGIAGIGGGKGIPDTPENRQKVFDFVRKDSGKLEFATRQKEIESQNLIADTRTQNKPSRFGGQTKAKPVFKAPTRQAFSPTSKTIPITFFNPDGTRKPIDPVSQRLGFTLAEVERQRKAIENPILSRPNVKAPSSSFIESPKVEPTITKAQESNLVVQVDRTKRSTRFSR